MMSKLRKPGRNVLNVYMCNIRPSSPTGPGYERWGKSTYPWDVKRWPLIDGVMVMNPCIPDANNKTLR